MLETMSGFFLIFALLVMQRKWSQRVNFLELRITELKQELLIVDTHRSMGLPSPAELEILRMKLQKQGADCNDPQW